MFHVRMYAEENQFHLAAAEILTILHRETEGISEYELLNELKYRSALFGNLLFSRPLNLFQNHFLLFHILYALRDELYRQKKGMLQIRCTKIMILPYLEGKEAMALSDPMRKYYLDLKNFETEEAEIINMLNNFWTMFQSQGERTKALETLGLEPHAEMDEIKKTYRKLVKEHHPDTGGDKEKLAEINLAMETINRSQSMPRQ